MVSVCGFAATGGVVCESDDFDASSVVSANDTSSYRLESDSDCASPYQVYAELFAVVVVMLIFEAFRSW
ncbi:hypothetical protein TNCV_1297681 [Trichonephila clavipes]|nr:hypothetical protein TNCV_1297681 [Trichonephila clavipes]